jgi:hypothetical protein
MTITPRRCKMVDDCSRVKRQVFCTHYGECLDHAIKKRWESFSCEQCQSYEDERPEVEWLAEDQRRCMRLIFSASAAAM